MIKPPKYLPGTIVYVFNTEDKNEILCVKVVGAVLNRALNKWEYFIAEHQEDPIPEEFIYENIEVFNR